jgi:hypothetical protein
MENANCASCMRAPRSLDWLQDIFIYSIDARAAIGFDWRFRPNLLIAESRIVGAGRVLLRLSLWHYAGRERH